MTTTTDHEERIPIDDEAAIRLLDEQKTAEGRIERLAAVVDLLDGRLREAKARAILRRCRLVTTIEALYPDAPITSTVVHREGRWWLMPRAAPESLAALLLGGAAALEPAQRERPAARPALPTGQYL